MKKQRHKKYQPPAVPGSAAQAPGSPQPRVVEPVPVNDLLHEPPEPAAQRGSIPIWLIAAIVLILYWADIYVVTHGADLGGKGGAFPETVYDPYLSYAAVQAANPVDPEREMFELGRRLYASKGCAACHQATGVGVPGQFPPLAGSEWVLTENPGRSIRIVLHGLGGPITVRGESYNNVMPPMGSTFDDNKQVAAVLTYIRNDWGNDAPPVTPEQVEKVKAELGARTEPYTAAELEQVPVAGP